MELRRHCVELARYGRSLVAAASGLALAACAVAPGERPAAVEIDLIRPGAAERLAEAIRIPTISWGDDKPTEVEAFDRLHAFLERSYPVAHATLEREIVNQHSRLYTWRGTDRTKQPILLAAHLDVVPPVGEWQHDPFSGTIDEDGMIWGRGALDDKLSVLGLLEAVEQLVAEGFTPERTIYLAFGHDEELEGELGAQTMAAMLEARGQSLAYVLDEGLVVGLDLVPGVAKPVAMIGVAEKGYLSIELTAKEAGGHSSTPPPITAIGRLARAIDRLQSNQLPAEIRPPVSEFLEAVAPEMSTFEQIAMSNQWLFGGLVASMLTDGQNSNAMVRTTTAPTIIKAGSKDNVLPQEASATVNFRILPGEDSESVTAHVVRVIDDELVEVAPIQASASDPIPASDTDTDSYREVERTVQQIFPEAVVAPALVIASTDSRHYRKLTDNIYRFLPVTLDAERLSGIHGTDERLESDAYRRLIGFYIQLMRNSAG